MKALVVVLLVIGLASYVLNGCSMGDEYATCADYNGWSLSHKYDYASKHGEDAAWIAARDYWCQTYPHADTFLGP